jgi:hypothetical protein
MAPTCIPSRNREWSSGARIFTLRTAASIVTASRYAPITRPTISSGNGAIAAAPRAIIYSNGQCFSVKCEWARIFRISVHARRPKGKTLHPPELHLPQPRPRRVLLRLAQIQVQQRRPVRRHQAHRLRRRPHRLRPAVRLPQAPDHQPYLPLRRRRRCQRLRVQMRPPPRLLQQLRLLHKERRCLVSRLQHQVRLHPRVGPRQLP